MNFVIFPMFFASSALYPLWHVKEASLLLYDICEINPFTHAVELIRFALYGQLEPTSAIVFVVTTAIFLTLAVYAYDPARGLMARRTADYRVASKHPFANSALVIALIAAATVRGATLPGEDPDWPCQQRLVPKLAAAAYWNGPPLDNVGDWQGDAETADLVRDLAPRRVSTEEGLSRIGTFAQSLSGDRPRRLALAFRGLLEETDRERAALIERLKQIGRRQRDLADLVAQLGAELNSIPGDPTGDAAAQRVDLQQRHDFTARNFEEIQRTIRYACETPVALDARLGAWAKALQNAASP